MTDNAPDPTTAMRHEARELICVPVNQADMDAYDDALAEFGFSIEDGGANHGDATAEASYERFAELGTRLAFARRDDGDAAKPPFVPHVILTSADGCYDLPDVLGPYASAENACQAATELFGDEDGSDVNWSVVPLS